MIKNIKNIAKWKYKWVISDLLNQYLFNCGLFITIKLIFSFKKLKMIIISIYYYSY